jgi:hypothetical protein
MGGSTMSENRKPGRPSGIKNKDQWARKTYMFNKNTLKKLKIHQAKTEEGDLSIIIDKALKAYLK